jgi:hypothetical protein
MGTISSFFLPAHTRFPKKIRICQPLSEAGTFGGQLLYYGTFTLSFPRWRKLRVRRGVPACHLYDASRASPSVPVFNFNFEQVLHEVGLSMPTSVSAIFPSWTVTLNRACSEMSTPKAFSYMNVCRLPNKTPHVPCWRRHCFINNFLISLPVASSKSFFFFLRDWC